MKKKFIFNWRKAASLLLLVLISIPVFSKSRVYIRNRYNGGFWGYKYVSTNMYPSDDRDIFVTNCVDPGLDRCRHNKIADGSSNDLDEELVNSTFDIAEKKSNNGETSGRINIGEEWIVIWSTNDSDDSAKFSKFSSIKIQFYTIEEASQLGLI